MIRKVEMERFTVTSSKPFDVVVAAIKALIGHPNTAELWRATQRATTAAELGTCFAISFMMRGFPMTRRMILDV